ncbi:Helicase SEN1 [Fusarium oxysporum f. sp. albedinis]|nr:Helicase SEN1 [Fusarium oxysporum f. sp. albedinis]
MFKRVQSGNLYVGSTPLLTYPAYPWLQKLLTRQPAITHRGERNHFVDPAPPRCNEPQRCCCRIRRDAVRKKTLKL